ncbi:unnamed protein product, partial [Dovyalis caffra]
SVEDYVSDKSPIMPFKQVYSRRKKNGSDSNPILMTKTEWQTSLSELVEEANELKGMKEQVVDMTTAMTSLVVEFKDFQTHIRVLVMWQR